MLRLRDNEQIIIEPMYGRDGLQIERVQCFDQTARAPVVEHRRAWSFQITLSGTCQIVYCDRAWMLTPNTIFWHSPLREALAIRWLPGTGAEAVVVACSARRWNAFVARHPMFREHNAALLSRYPARPVFALQFVAPPLLDRVRRLIALSQGSSAAAPALETCCAVLLQQIGDLRFVASSACQDHERWRRVERAQERMAACLAQPPSLAQIAAELNVSPRQLQRDFRIVTGLTPMRYLTLVRLSEANTLLAETALPIAQIARLLGYVSPAHFSAAFRRIYHCSPRQVRGLLQKPPPEMELWRGE
jgi:AraC-like DNA-binding protein